MPPSSPDASLPPQTTAHRLSALLPVLLGVAFVVYFLAVAAARARFPLQLEWLEGTFLDSIHRVLHGQPIYVAPTHQFVPFLYTPLYYYVGAGVCHLFGLGFAPLRWLSTLCTLGCLGLLYRLTREWTGSPRAGLLASGLFAACYASAAAGWYDLARVDMLSLLLLLTAIYVLWRNHCIAAAVLFALAYQSKQGAAIVAVCALLSLWKRPRQCVAAMATFLGLTLLSAVYLNHASSGWYGFYTRWLPSHLPLTAMGVVYLGARDLGRYLLPSLLLIVWAAYTKRNALRQQSPRTCFLLFCGAGCALDALAGRLHTGGGPNVSIPLFAWMAVLFGVSVHRLQAHPRWMVRVSVLACLQFAILFTWPARLLPTHAACQEGARFVAQMAAYDGDVFVVNNVADLVPAGKQAFANSDASFDVIRTGDGPVSRALRADLAQSFRERRYSAILAPAPIRADTLPVGFPADIGRYYDLTLPPAWTEGQAEALRAVQMPRVGPVYLYPVRKTQP